MSNDREKCAQRDSRDSTELVEEILLTDDEEGDSNLLSILHARGSEAEFELARSLSLSHDPNRRALGADILGQLGWSDRTFLEESVNVLIELLKDREAEVLYSAAVALGHRNHLRAIPYLAALKEHQDPLVRFGVSVAMGGCEDELAVSVLIDLSRDPDRDTRNWATFGLARLIEIDTPAIRAALLERIGDSDHEVRGEALVGLATRRHPDALEYVRKELSREFIGVLALEAAEELATPELYSILQEIQSMFTNDSDTYFTMHIEDALNACKPKN